MKCGCTTLMEACQAYKMPHTGTKLSYLVCLLIFLPLTSLSLMISFLSACVWEYSFLLVFSSSEHLACVCRRVSIDFSISRASFSSLRTFAFAALDWGGGGGERRGEERTGQERRREERRGKERKGEERRGKERRGEET